jgi:hypothetical protein
MPVKIKHKQLKKIQWVDYENYFHNYMNNDLYETLQMKDIYELYNRISGEEVWQTTLEKKAATEALKKHPNIFRIEYSKKNTEAKANDKPKITENILHRPAKRTRYEQTAADLVLEKVREANYDSSSEKHKINTPKVSNEDEKAIGLFENQKRKIDNFPNPDDEFWRNETLGLIEKFIGADSSQFGLISSHTFFPNPNAINPETESSQRERGRKMIDLCINHIKAHGLKKETTRQPIINYHNHNIIQSGNIYQDLSRDNKIDKHSVNMKSPNEISKNPTIEKWGLWIAIASCFIALLTGLKSCGII